jgi:hypothetical protein
MAAALEKAPALAGRQPTGTANSLRQPALHCVNGCMHPTKLTASASRAPGK